MKRKQKIKPFTGVRLVSVGEFGPDDSTQGLMELLSSMGYLFYYDPTDSESCIIVSDHKVTLGEFEERFDQEEWFNVRWWNEETDFNERLNDELDKIFV